jgi:sugar phosphate isomerase/epimerase
VAGSVRAGIVHYAAYPEAASSAEVFWRSVEPMLADPVLDVVEVSTYLPLGAADRLAGAAAAHDTTLYLSAGPRLIAEPGLCSLDPGHRRAATDLVKSFVDLAFALRAGNLMVVSGPAPAPADRPAALDALADALAEIGDYAATGPGRGLTVSVESFPRDRPPGQLVGPTAEAVLFLETVRRRCDNVWLTADLAHLAQLGEDPVASVTAIGTATRHLHLSTCVLEPGHPLDGDQHPGFDVPGGRVSIDTARRALGAATGPVVASIEVRPQPGEDADAVYARTRSQLLAIARPEGVPA